MKTDFVPACYCPRPVVPPAVVLLLAALTSLPAFAQTKDAALSPAALAKYDLNKNGRLDPDEESAMLAAEARSAKVPVQSTAPDTGTAPVQLSPFEVREATTGYLATNTMSGTRLNTNIDDLASSISVVTKQQMADFAMLDINDIFAYEAGAEGAGTYTPFEIDRNGRVADSVMSDRESANRLRGVGAANISRSGFATSGRVPIDPIDIDAVEISRGPNSSIFGLGEGSGTVNMVAASANLKRATSTTQLRFDDTGGWRTSFDLSRPIIPGKLAARVSAVYQHDEANQKPSSYNTRRLNAMVRAQPFKNTTLRASFQSYLADGTRATAMTPRDGVSDWRALGRPTWDPITQTVTRNGVSTTMTGTNNPAGLANMNRAGPILFVDNGGIQLWTISRLPAANATNGPSNIGGVNRLLESIPEPVRDGRPLFSIVRGVSDPSIYDYAHINLSGPNYQREEVATSTVEFEQYLFNTGRNTAAFQFAWQREDADRLRRTTVGSTNPVGTSGLIYVDANSRLLDGRLNPFFLKPYVGVAEPVWSTTPYERDTYRAQLAYVLDLTKEKSKWLQLLGRQQFLGYYEERKSKNHVYRFRDVMISDHPVYAPAGQPKGSQGAANGFAVSQQATRPYFHYYVGDANGQNVDYAPSQAEAGNYDFTWFDPKANRWVTDRATFGESAISEASAGENAASTLNLIQTKGAILQSTLFQNRLVTTFGRRSDQSGDKRQNRVFLKPNGYEFDYARMDGWRGDWDIRQGDTTTSGAVFRPFRDWRFIETARSGAGLTAKVASALQGLGLFYNRSDSFRPAGPAISIRQTELPNPGSVGKDYGFTLSLGNKFMLRANHYSTLQINARAGQGTNIANRLLQVDFDGIGGVQAFGLQRQARNWITQGTSGISAAAREA
ncbi:MAG: TonB-dependent receptor plug domain-containing protein, partial [Opitutaceae bacterium]